MTLHIVEPSIPVYDEFHMAALHKVAWITDHMMENVIILFKYIFDLVSGNAEPSGLLPVELPANMETVERQCEDRPFDMEVYVDQAGNSYGYAFGMNWEGVIQDERVTRYPKRS